MIIERNELIKDNNLYLEVDNEFSDEDLLQVSNFKHIESLKVYVNCMYDEYSSFLQVSVQLEGKLKMLSTRTLKPLDYELDESDEYSFSFTEKDELEESVIYIKDDYIDLHDYLVSTIVSSLPVKLIAQDDPEYIKGSNWEVMSEDEYNKRKSSTNQINWNGLSLDDFEDDEDEK